ncbi:hypothetical protein PanWU01x14_321050 [Parasponia andersonii]|uniref:Cystatin domain containing protein n=1 Tax=Parasponia andersonii TaxID=3476 RepID=A0A2P5ALD8_PARAD|nr:hypothetical protein PanWU01x14_321050 [Parasponia andersonii]
MKLFSKYQKQVRAYEGFYVDVNAYKKCSGSGLIAPVAEVNELGKDLKLERTVRANEKFMGAGFMFYLTLEANDKCFYEAKVYRKASNGDNTLKFFRRAKYYPKASSKKKKKSTEPKLAEV